MSIYLKSKPLLEQWYLTDNGIESLNLICQHLESFFGNFFPKQYIQLGSIGHKEFSKSVKAENTVLVEEYKVPLTEHIVGEFDLLPVLEDHFDIIVLPHVLETCEPNGILFESYRVLKPGGILVVIGFDINIPGSIFGYFHSTYYKEYMDVAQAININVLNKTLAMAGFKLINNKHFSVKKALNSKALLGKLKIQKLLSLFASDIHVSISKKQITNLELIKNKNSLFSKKTLSLPGDTAWD